MTSKQKKACAVALIAGILPFVVPTKVVSGTAQFDQNPFISFSATPTITGTANNIKAPLIVSVFQKGTGSALGHVVYTSASLLINNGHWRVIIAPSIANGKYILEAASGGQLLATSSLTIGLQSLPGVALDTNSLPVYDVADGRLMRFFITANPSGSVGINQLTFAVDSETAAVSQLNVTVFSDPQYSDPIASSTGVSTTSSPDTSASVFSVVFPSTLELAAGQTAYVEVDAAVVPTDTTYYSVTTTLLSDSVATSTTDVATLQSESANVIWSPNTYDIATTTETDWTTGWEVVGLPQDGLSETRTGEPQENPPSCSVTTSATSTLPGQPFTVAWSSANANYARWPNSSTQVPSAGSETVSASSTKNFTLVFYGPYGATPCSTTITIAAAQLPPPPMASSTDEFTATPISGSVPLTVAFKGNVNVAASCSAVYYLFSYGDKTTVAQTVIPAKSCKAQAISYSHAYSTTGTYTAALYKSLTSSLSTTSAQLIQSQVIVVSAKKTAALDTSSNLANVFSIWKQLASFFDHTSQLFGW